MLPVRVIELKMKEMQFDENFRYCKIERASPSPSLKYDARKILIIAGSHRNAIVKIYGENWGGERQTAEL